MYGKRENDAPSHYDIVFRKGQSWFGTQTGKANEMLYDTLQETKGHTEILRKIAEAGDNRDQSTPNIRDLQRSFSSEFENVVSAQRELGHHVRDLGYVGQMALQEAEAQSDYLNLMSRGAVASYHQRNAALKRLSQMQQQMQRNHNEAQDSRFWSMMEQRESNDHLRDINSGVSRLGNSIENGVVDISNAVRLSAGLVGKSVEDMNKALSAALGDMGSGIENLSSEMVTTRLQISQILQDQQEIFLWSHREQMWVRKQALHALQNPRRTQAYESWEIGEECRYSGNHGEAERMYRESLHMNPAEARNHISLGLLNLQRGKPRKAKECFGEGARFSRDPSLQASALLHWAKIEMFERNFQSAKQLLDVALKSDITNLEVWFDLAIAEQNLGNTAKSLYYIRNLLAAPLRLPKKQAAAASQYILKIMSETAFIPLMPQIKRIIKDLI